MKKVFILLIFLCSFFCANLYTISGQENLQSVKRVNLQVYGANGDGKTDNSGVLRKLVDEAINSNIEVIVPKGVYKISNSISLPPNIGLTFDQGGMISVDKGVNVYLSGNIKAGVTQIFTGQGKIIGGIVQDGVVPQWMGAVGDGKTNDTFAVQSAMEYAATLSGNKVVFFPKGTYCVRNLRYCQGIQLKGSGTQSILKAHPSCVDWDGILYCNDLNNVFIDGITFDGNKPTIPGNDQKGVVNIWVTSSSNIQIQNCTFQHNWFLGICLKNSNQISINNNRFIDLDCGVITTDSPSSNIFIRSNFFDGAKMSEPVSIFGLKKGYHNNVVITDNIMKNHTQGSGILLRAVKTVVVKNNTIDNCGTGIFCTASVYDNVEYGVYDANISNNKISNSIYEGLQFTNLNSSIVSENKIESTGTYGILTKNVNICSIINNIVNNSCTTGLNGGCAFNLQGLRNSIISGNKISVTRKDISYRSHFYLSGKSIPTENNIFIGNITTPSNIKTFIIDEKQTQNNTIQNNRN